MKELFQHFDPGDAGGGKTAMTYLEALAKLRELSGQLVTVKPPTLFDEIHDAVEGERQVWLGYQYDANLYHTLCAALWELIPVDRTRGKTSVVDAVTSLVEELKDQIKELEHTASTFADEAAAYEREASEAEKELRRQKNSMGNL